MKCIKCKKMGYYRCTICGTAYCQECIKEVIESMRMLAVVSSAKAGMLISKSEEELFDSLYDDEKAICLNCSQAEANWFFINNDVSLFVREVKKTCVKKQ